MINTKHLLKVSAAWVTITYVVCFLAVAFYPPIRSQFALYVLHTTFNPGQNVMTVVTFISGLITWNILGFLGVGLFAWLFNKIKG